MGPCPLDWSGIMLYHGPSILPTGNIVGAALFGIVLVGAWTLFGLRVRHLIRLLRLGQPENRLDHLGERIGFFLKGVLGQPSQVVL